MPTAEQQKLFTNFVQGLNTEATPLNFPENSAQEVNNFDLSRTGEVKRRLGLEFETGYELSAGTTSANQIDTYAISTHDWKAVNGKGDTNFLVIQVGTTLYLHDAGAEPMSGSLRGTIDLSPHKTGSTPENKVIDTDFGEGIMVVANPELETVIVEYVEDTDAFEVTPIKLRFRDFDGIEESGNPKDDTRSGTLTKDHTYNLKNQGWPSFATVNRADDGNSSVYRRRDPIQWTKAKLGLYPSNADIFHTAKATTAADVEVVGSFSPWVLETNTFGNTPAPKGHYILDVFSQDRQSVSGITGLNSPIVSTDQRASVVAFYAGRIFYMGIAGKEYTGDIFFSSSLTKLNKAGECYQSQDPTAEDLNSLLATDGGRIHVADMGQVSWASQVGQDLIIVSSTGVYAISGTSGANFTADDHSIRKITDEGATSKEAITEAEGSVFWWSNGGIWNMSPGQVPENLEVNRISRDTIQGFYETIDPASRAYCRGVYDDTDKKIYWLYNDEVGYDAINFRFKYNRALILDLTTGGWYTYTLGELASNSPWIAGMSSKVSGDASTITYDIVVDEDDVVESADDIVQDVAFEVFTDVKLKALTFVQNEDTTYSYVFSEFSATDFYDWTTWDQVKNDISNLGISYDSVLQTGWNDFADPLRPKRISHLTSFFNRTESGYELDSAGELVFTNPSGGYVQTRWEYTDLDTGRWTSEEQAYRLDKQYIPSDDLDNFDYGEVVVKSKLRMRGQGAAFSIRYTSETGKDLQLIGFAVNVRAPSKI